MTKATFLTHLQPELINGQPVDPDNVFDTLEQQRDQDILSESVTRSALRYQASMTHPDYLEQITSEGAATIGQFRNGNFHPVELD